jgi:CyaY protein
MHELSEQDFNREVDRIQDLIEHAVDAQDLDLEMVQIEGSLILRREEGSRLVIGRQPASRELWLAAAGSTLHFGYRPGEGWVHDGDDETLGEVLDRVLSELVGDEVELGLDEV